MHGDSQEPDAKEFVFEGEYFFAKVAKGDLKSLYSQLKLAICEVLDYYDKIGERYLELMDDETSERISNLYSTVEEIESIIRYQSWLKGVK